MCPVTFSFKLYTVMYYCINLTCQIIWSERMKLLNIFGVGVSCRILFSVVGYLYVSGSGSVTSVRE